MSNVFFDKGSSFSTYDKVLRDNEQALRMRRLAKAEEALQHMEQEIKVRQEALNKISTFVENKQANYEQLAKQYEMIPSTDAAQQMAELKQIIEEVHAKLKQTRPEQVIADLISKYEEFKSVFAQKKALIDTHQNMKDSSPKNDKR